jgi:hypothetical protein
MCSKTQIYIYKREREREREKMEMIPYILVIGSIIHRYYVQDQIYLMLWV